MENTAAEQAFGPILDYASAARGVALADVGARAMAAVDLLDGSDRQEFATLVAAWAPSVRRLAQALPLLRAAGLHCPVVTSGRPRGRPPVADKRLPRVKMNGAEWGEVQRKAEAAGMTAAAWVRMRCGV